MKKLVVLFFLILGALSTTGCFFQKDVNTDQVGIVLYKNAIERIVPPGVYSDGRFFSDLRTVNVKTMTFSVEDPEVATSDNQLVGIKITIQARRLSDDTSIRNMLTNWSVQLNDEKMIETVSATAREGIKNGTRGFTLNTLLDDRNGLAESILAYLEEDAQKYSVEIVNVTIENVALAPDYVKLMQDRANVTAQIELEVNKQNLIKQSAANDRLAQEQRNAVLQAQLEAEKAKTAVDLEIAGREGKIIGAKNAIYETNQYAYELERLRLLATIFGDKAVFYFLPAGIDLNLLFTPGGTTPLPIPQ